MKLTFKKRHKLLIPVDQDPLSGLLMFATYEKTLATIDQKRS